jgi:hypothetical protein
MTDVIALLKWGSGEWVTLVVACGHSRRLRRVAVAREQLYVGKCIPCPQCLAEQAGAEPR